MTLAQELRDAADDGACRTLTPYIPPLLERAAEAVDALIAMRDRDDRNGSLPTWYREQIDAAIGNAEVR